MMRSLAALFLAAAAAVAGAAGPDATDITALLQLSVRVGARAPEPKHWEKSVVLGPRTSSFTSNSGLFCAEGPARITEGALALKKAGPLGALYSEVFAKSNQTCAQRGYTYSSGEDGCYPGVATFFQSPEAKASFEEAEAQALEAFRANYSMPLPQAELLAACTCHPGSAKRASRGAECASLGGLTGSWVHRNPQTGSELLCDDGPIVTATVALAILKSTAQLPMHQHDQIAPVACSSRGFPVRQTEIDHCFPPMWMWSREPDDTDAGIEEAQQVEAALFGGNFSTFCHQHDLEEDILFSKPGCHCFASSSVGQSLKGQCDRPEDRSPISDWAA